MVAGRPITWQKTPPNGDCLYEAIALALHEARLTAAPYAVAVLHELTARDIERRLDDYRAWIPVATDQDLRALSAGLPRAGAFLPAASERSRWHLPRPGAMPAMRGCWHRTLRW